MPRIIDIEDNLLPKTDSQNLEFLSALESGISEGGGVYVVNPSSGAPMNVSSNHQYVGTTNYDLNFLFNVV